MKNYTIIALPERKIGSDIEKLRMNVTKNILVDSLPPHVTFKRRFKLSGDFLEVDLVNYFKKLRLKKFRANFVGRERINDALALIGSSDEMKCAHISLVNDLNGKIVTKNPEWEKDNYKIHMTLFRGLVNTIVFPEIKVVVFDKLAVYEIDSGPERLFAKEIVSIDLE